MGAKLAYAPAVTMPVRVWIGTLMLGIALSCGGKRLPVEPTPPAEQPGANPPSDQPAPPGNPDTPEAPEGPGDPDVPEEPGEPDESDNEERQDPEEPQDPQDPSDPGPPEDPGSPAPPSPPGPPPPPEPPPSFPVGPVILTDAFGGRPLSPPGHWWTQDISAAPVDSASDAFIDFVGRSRRLHPDFGPPPYGIPYIGVSGSQPRLPVTFVAYGSESDTGIGGLDGYPIPDEARTLPNYIEGGVPGGGTSGDRHLLVVDRDRWLLYELFAARWNAAAGRWEAGSGAIFDLNSMARRPEGWTSADAAGLSILPGLVRYDEVMSGEIDHAFRVTVRATNGYVWPASHRAGGTPGALPMGARLRLKASKDLSGFPADLQRIFRAMQRYGLIVADNGSDMYITGAMDPRWNNDRLNPAFRALTADDFEVVQLGWR